MLDSKIAENKKILAEKEDLVAQVQVEDSYVHELREEVAKLTFSRDDWLQAIDAVKTELEEEMASLQRVHARTVELLKSKIW